MSRFWIFVGMMVLAMLLLFFVLEALHLPFLEDDTAFWLQQDKWVAGLLGVGLLIADVVAPVPSSMIMFANGILFGVVLGGLLSLAGSLGATFWGHWIGSKGDRIARRWMGDEALRRANAFFQRHGPTAVIASRPIPILAEAVSIVAGLSGMGRKQLLYSSLIGLVPTVILYGFAGAYAQDMQSGLYAFLVVFALATVSLLIGRRVMKRSKPVDTV